MLIGLINKLVDIENSKEDAEQALMQLFQHKEEYNTLCTAVEKYIVEKRKERIINMQKHKEEVLSKYGYFEARCTTAEFPTMLTEGKVYGVIVKGNGANFGDCLLFDDNNKLRLVGSNFLSFINNNKVRHMKCGKRIPITKIDSMEISKEDFDGITFK